MIATVARRFPKATTLLLGLSILALALYCAHTLGLVELYSAHGTAYVWVGAGSHNVELGIGQAGGFWVDQI